MAEISIITPSKPTQTSSSPTAEATTTGRGETGRTTTGAKGEGAVGETTLVETTRNQSLPALPQLPLLPTTSSASSLGLSLSLSLGNQAQLASSSNSSTAVSQKTLLLPYLPLLALGANTTGFGFGGTSCITAVAKPVTAASIESILTTNNTTTTTTTSNNLNPLNTSTLRELSGSEPSASAENQLFNIVKQTIHSGQGFPVESQLEKVQGLRDGLVARSPGVPGLSSQLISPIPAPSFGVPSSGVLAPARSFQEKTVEQLSSEQLNAAPEVENIVESEPHKTTNTMHQNEQLSYFLEQPYLMPESQFTMHSDLHSLPHIPTPPSLNDLMPGTNNNSLLPSSFTENVLVERDTREKHPETMIDIEKNLNLKKKEDIAKAAYRVWLRIKPGHKEQKDRWWALYYRRIQARYHLRDNHLGRKINAWIEEEMNARKEDPAFNQLLHQQMNVVKPGRKPKIVTNEDGTLAKKRKANSSKDGTLPAYINVELVHPKDDPDNPDIRLLKSVSVDGRIDWTDEELEADVEWFKNNRHTIMETVPSQSGKIKMPLASATKKSKVQDIGEVQINNSVSWLKMDVHKTNDAYFFKADIPGLSPSSLVALVQTDGNKIVIKGERKREHSLDLPESNVPLISNRPFGPFEVTILLPQLADATKTNQTYFNGVLTVKVPLRIREWKALDIQYLT